LLLSCSQDALTSGSSDLCGFAITSGNSAVFDYYIQEVNNKYMRSGQIIAVWDTNGATYTEYSTPDLNGSTAPFRFAVTNNGTDVKLVGNVASGTWKVHVGTRIVI
jgi:hypothetical protein